MSGSGASPQENFQGNSLTLSQRQRFLRGVAASLRGMSDDGLLQRQLDEIDVNLLAQFCSCTISRCGSLSKLPCAATDSW